MRRVVGFTSRIRRGGARRGEGTRGQSLTELALVLPVFILIVLIGLDLGRAFLGWVGLQQAARIAANFASVNATAWDTPGNAQTRNRYKDLILNESQDIDWNCDLPSRGSLPDPTFPAGNKNVGSPAKVTLTCAFKLATPIIAAFLPNPLSLGGSASFPIRNGPLAGQAAAPGNVPNSVFTYSPALPQSGQSVQFFDASTNSPTGWVWTFSDDGSTSTVQFPSHTFTCASGVCPYTVTLTASNINGTDQTPASQTINVQSLNPAPVACFTPTTGTYLAPVSVTFTDCSQHAPYSWSWNFGDGTSLVTGGAAPASTSHIFQCSGSCAYTVTLTVNNGTSPPSGYSSSPLNFSTQFCSTPNFVGHLVQTAADLTNIQSTWNAAGFHDNNLNPTNVNYNPSTGLPAGPGSQGKTYHVTSQNRSGTQACTTLITLTWALAK
jgi:hypothetical protein